MPPKGWRKSADGSYPVPSKERDMISIDDILFPKATVNRLGRAILPEGNIISKDSSTALQRSATVFVSYLLVHAREHAKKFDRRTIGPQDITNALVAAEFSSFLPTVKQELDTYQAHKDVLKQKRKESKEQGNTTATGNDTIDDKDNEAANEEATEEANEGDDGDDSSLEQLDQSEFEQPVSKKIKSLANASREDTVSEPDTDQN